MENSRNNQLSFIIALILIIVAAITRIIPHPFNFTAVGAIALFSGAIFRDKRTAYLMPFAIMFLTDIFLGFHFSMIPVYACLTFAVWIGVKLKKNQNIFSIISGSLISSFLFFLITNLPFWYLDLKLYPMTVQGTMESYRMAIPFFKNQVIGDLFYTGILFGTYHLVFRYINPLSEQKVR